MATDLRLVVPNRPGTLLAVCEAIAAAGVGIDGLCGDLRPGEMWGYLHILVEDAAGARRAIEAAGFEVAGEHSVEIYQLEPRMGAIFEAIRAHSERGENVEVAYMASETRLVVGTEAMRAQIPGVRMKDARY